MHVKALEWKGLMTRRHAPNAIVDASSGDGEHQERSRLREVADELLQRKLAVSETKLQRRKAESDSDAIVQEQSLIFEYSIV